MVPEKWHMQEKPTETLKLWIFTSKEGMQLFDVFEVILEVFANDHGVLIFTKDIGQNPMSIFVPPRLPSGCETNEFADARGPLPWWVTLVEMPSLEGAEGDHY